MHDSKTLSKRSIPELELIARKLEVNTKYFSNNRNLYVDAIIRQQYQFLKTYFSCQPEKREIYARQLKHLVAHIQAQLSSYEITLAVSLNDTFDPVIFTLQNEAIKVDKVIDLLNEAVEILNDCEIKNR